jgi:uncharacterized protein YyaL (SSP411 family)
MKLQQIVELFRERMRIRQPNGTPDTHLAAAMQWLFAAQDVNGDGGVSHSYLLGERWMRSYPETTGYIIPTVLNWARLHDDDAITRRALAMADFEIKGQLASGAVPNLVNAAPTVFDTGQVIFGWVAAFRHSGDAEYLEAAHRGGAWLLDELDADGIWRHESDSGGPGRVYNMRTAWALLELADASQDERYTEAAQRFGKWTLSQEKGDGWFDHNCLNNDGAPLLHTIAYTARGQLESGLLLNDQSLVDSARRTARRLAGSIRANGSMPGRYNSDWKGAVRWSCLTGMAQSSIIWQRLASLEDTDAAEAKSLIASARAANQFLMRTQDLSASHLGLRGGIRGSYPVNGSYGQWQVLNWATKFFADALMADHPDHDLVFKG